MTRANHAEIDRLQPPQSLDAEQAVLGAIMKDDEAMSIVIEVLDDAGHFYVPKHRFIFEACLELFEKNEPCDITTVSNCLHSAGNLEKVGGRVYLVELVEGVASTANVRSYADIVLEKSTLRWLIETSNEIIRSAYEETQDARELLDQAEASIFGIAESRVHRGFRTVASVIPQSLDHVEMLQSGGKWTDGISTGLRDLDSVLMGMKAGEMIIVAGRPSMGKTSLAMNIAEYVADTSDRKAVAVFSAEMSLEQLVLRMLCGKAGISNARMRNNRLTDDEMRTLTQAGNALAKMSIFVDDSAIMTPLQIRARARRLKAQCPELALIVIDYIQMLQATGRQENRQQEVSVISRSLKALAKELQVPVLVCSQLSRAVELRGGDRRPQLADLRESGAIEQDADVVMFVYRPEYYLTDDERKDPKNVDKLGVAELIVAKQRSGPVGTVRATFRKEIARFADCTPAYRLPDGAEPIGRPQEAMPF